MVEESNDNGTYINAISSGLNSAQADGSREDADLIGESIDGMAAATLPDPGEDSVYSEGEGDSFGEQTILSSNASFEDYDHATSSDVAPPRLRPSPSSPLSIATCSSVYMEVDGEGLLGNHQESPNTFSIRSSLFDSSFFMSSIDIGSQNAENKRLSSMNSLAASQIQTLEEKPSALPLVQHPPLLLATLGFLRLPWLKGEHNTDWFSDFTEEDWDRFYARANVVLRSHLPAVVKPVHRLPPLPPPRTADLIVRTDEKPLPVPAALVSSLLVCVLCRDVIVGALTLDCECGTNVCTACWEYRSVTKLATRPSLDLAYHLDYTVIPSNENGTMQSDCPCCLRVVHRPLACNALDVAILRIVEGLDKEHSSFQLSYYQRLTQWRNELARRQFEESSNDAGSTCDERILAQLVFEEENLWQRRNKACARNFFVPAIFVSVAAMVASIVTTVLAKNHRASS